MGDSLRRRDTFLGKPHVEEAWVGRDRTERFAGGPLGGQSEAIEGAVWEGTLAKDFGRADSTGRFFSKAVPTKGG